MRLPGVFGADDPITGAGKRVRIALVTKPVQWTEGQ